MNAKQAPSQQAGATSGISSRIIQSRFFFYVFLASFAFILIFLLLSSIELLNPDFHASLSSRIFPYFWIFLLFVGQSNMSIPHLEVSIPSVTVFQLVVVMISLYATFFAVMILSSFIKKNGDRTILRNSVIFYGAMTTFGLLVSFLVIALEQFAGIPIGGGGIVNNSDKYLTYVSLIYAPFVEELGFRILPLGIYAMVLISLYRPFRKDVVLAFFGPGYVRRKYGLKLGYVGYALIIITSAFFGYAHVLYGGWDWGKFLQASLVGVILAFGYLEFGMFVDIPMHWFYNGVLTVTYLLPSASVLTDLAIFWFLFVGILTAVFLLFLSIRGAKAHGHSVTPKIGSP